MNEQILTRQEIEQQFDGEWVLVDEAETDENLHVVRGIVRAHSLNRRDLSPIARELVAQRSPRRMAFLCFKNRASGQAFLL